MWTLPWWYVYIQISRCLAMQLRDMFTCVIESLTRSSSFIDSTTLCLQWPLQQRHDNDWLVSWPVRKGDARRGYNGCWFPLLLMKKWLGEELRCHVGWLSDRISLVCRATQVSVAQHERVSVKQQKRVSILTISWYVVRSFADWWKTWTSG